jgi:hypothetical protein
MSAKTGDAKLFGRPSGWFAYCKGIALGSGFAASAAKLVVILGANTPSQALRKCEAKLIAGEFDQESYRNYVEAIELTEDMHNRGVQTHMVHCGADDWDKLPSGGHVRRNHLGNHA